MRRGLALGFTLYVAFFALTIGLRWRQLGQPYGEFQWITAHSQIIVDNWLEHGFWNERGSSFWNPPSIEFPSLVSRDPYISYPCGAQLPIFVLVKVLGRNVTPGFFHIWGLVWHGLIGLLLIYGLWLFDADGKEPERSLGAFLPGFLWLGGRGPLTFFPTMWYADIVVLLPFVLVGLAEVIVAHALLPERHRRWITWSLPVLIFWGMYTDWLFVPLCAVILLYRLLRRRDIRATSSAFLWQIALPAALALTLFFLQLFWVLGPHFVPALLERFLVRSMDTPGEFHGLSMLWHVYGYFVASDGRAGPRFDSAGASSALHKTQDDSQPIERFPLPLVCSVRLASPDFSAARGDTLVHYRQIHDPNICFAGKHTAPGSCLSTQATCVCSAV